MTTREIPRAFEYICDVCGKKYVQENAGGQYFDSRPPFWARLVIKQDARDFQGRAVAADSIERLLCDDCRAGIIAAINAWSDKRRARAPGMTDLMVTPESLDAYLKANPPPANTEATGEAREAAREALGLNKRKRRYTGLGNSAHSRAANAQIAAARSALEGRVEHVATAITESARAAEERAIERAMGACCILCREGFGARETKSSPGTWMHLYKDGRDATICMASSIRADALRSAK